MTRSRRWIFNCRRTRSRRWNSPINHIPTPTKLFAGSPWAFSIKALDAEVSEQRPHRAEAFHLFSRTFGETIDNRQEPTSPSPATWSAGEEQAGKPVPLEQRSVLAAWDSACASSLSFYSLSQRFRKKDDRLEAHALSHHQN